MRSGFAEASLSNNETVADDVIPKNPKIGFSPWPFFIYLL